MHVLSTPPAFVLSQDQTLRKRLSINSRNCKSVINIKSQITSRKTQLAFKTTPDNNHHKRMADTSNAFTKIISALTFIDTLLSSQRTRTHSHPTSTQSVGLEGNCSSVSQLGLGHKARLLGDTTCRATRPTSFTQSVKTGSVSVALTRQKLRHQPHQRKSAGRPTVSGHLRSSTS